MSNPLPSLIIGPAIVTWNGHTYYTKGGVKAEFKRETFKIETDMDGQIDERMKTQMLEVSFQPVGMIADLTGFYYTVSQVGKSIFTSSALPLVIVTKFGGASNTGQTITYPRAGLLKLPQFRLKATDTLFGDMAFACPGVPTVQPNTSTAWETIADAAFADTTFDETKIVTDIYHADYGSSPFAAMGSKTGFEIDITAEMANIEDDSYGIVDIILKSLTGSAKFVPNNLTQANVATLMNYQNTGYVFPGQSLSPGSTDLVVVGSGNNGLTLTATLKNAGPKGVTYMYGIDKHRYEGVEFTSKRTWTSGTANSLFTMAVA